MHPDIIERMVNLQMKRVLGEIDKIMKDAAKDIFYCDPDEDGEREIWEPFEDWDKDDIDEQVDNVTTNITNYLVHNKDKIIELLSSI